MGANLVRVCVCVCVCVLLLLCVRARACVCACVHARSCVSVCVRIHYFECLAACSPTDEFRPPCVFIACVYHRAHARRCVCGGRVCVRMRV